MSESSAQTAGMAIGAMFLSVFGCAWMLGWSTQAYSSVPAVSIAIILAGCGLLGLAYRRFSRHKSALSVPGNEAERKAMQRRFNRVNMFQWLAVVAAVGILANTGRAQWIPAAIMLIVGLHFFPLASLFAYRWHFVTGAAFVVLALAYPFLLSGGPADPRGLLGAGLILWLSAAGVLIAA